MKRQFIYTDEFDKIWRREKIGTTRLLELEQELLENPKAGDVIQGSGGLRKLRLGSEQSGKRGGLRILYVDFQEYSKTYFITLLNKRDTENLSQKEIKEIRNLILELKQNAKDNFNKKFKEQ